MVIRKAVTMSQVRTGFHLLLLVVFCGGGATLMAGQNLRELARELGPRNPGQPLYWPAPPGEYSPKGIEKVAAEADVVLRAKLSRSRSYLGPNEDRILTDYSILDGRVIAGRLPLLATRTPGTSIPLILTVYGGDVIVDGVLIRGTDGNFEAIKDGGEYLLFLKQSRSSEVGRYEVLDGAVFEILQENVRPLLKQADILFKGTVPARLNELLSKITGGRTGYARSSLSRYRA